MAVYHKNLKYHEDDIEKHKITTDEIEFLKSLQKEMNTQDHIGQADPRFWVIKGTEKIFHVDEADGYQLVDYDNWETLAENTKEICDYINEELLEEINSNRCKGEEFTVEYEEGICSSNIVIKWHDTDNDEMVEELSTLNEIQEWLEEQGYEYSVVSYQIVPKIYENTMFLTQKDAENHLKANDYHYSNDAHTYAMTAWRSPTVERLVKILQEVDFDSLVKDIK